MARKNAPTSCSLWQAAAQAIKRDLLIVCSALPVFCSVNIKIASQLRQTNNLASLVNINMRAGGHFGQAGHGHNFAANCHNKTCAAR